MQPYFELRKNAPPGTMMYVRLEFPHVAAGTMLTLPAPDVTASAFVRVGTMQHEVAVSGTLTVQAADMSRFQAAFDLQLLTDDGQSITLTGGQASVSGCAVGQTPKGTCPDSFS